MPEADAARRGARARRACAARSARARSTSFEDFTLYDRCITRGVLGSLLPVIYGNGLRIVQNPSSVAISYEMIHDTRIIPLDGRPHVDAGVRQYMGNARGHWEGDTLVVETTNFTDKTSIGVNGNGPPNSEQLKITERFTRVDPRDDRVPRDGRRSRAYTAPFTIRLMITTQPNYEIYEYSCHEGNGAVGHALSGERAYERQVAEAKAKGLPIAGACRRARSDQERRAGRGAARVQHQRGRVSGALALAHRTSRVRERRRTHFFRAWPSRFEP